MEDKEENQVIQGTQIKYNNLTSEMIGSCVDIINDWTKVPLDRITPEIESKFKKEIPFLCIRVNLRERLRELNRFDEEYFITYFVDGVCYMKFNRISQNLWYSYNNIVAPLRAACKVDDIKMREILRYLLLEDFCINQNLNNVQDVIIGFSF